MQQTHLIPPLSKDALSTLQNNFQNIYSALHSSENGSLEIVPGLWGEEVYHAQAGWKGRVLSIIYSMFRFFSGNDCFKKNRLQYVIKKTDEIYRNLVSQVAPHLKAYAEYLEEKCDREQSPLELKIHHSRKEIKRFYEATHNFSKLIKRVFVTPFEEHLMPHKLSDDQRLHKKIKTFVSDYFSNDLEKKVFYEENIYLETVRSIHIMALEGISKGPIPLNKIKQASIYRESNLKAWVRKLNEEKDSLNIKVFNQGIASIVDHIRAFNPSRGAKPKLENIQLALCDANFSGFELFDAKHLKWRNSLREGDEINLISEKIILGEQLSGKSSKIDKHLVFEVKDESNQIDPYRVLVIGPNRSTLKLRELIRQDINWGIQTANVFYEDPKGRFFLVEKLEKSLKNIKWDNQDCLSKNDLETARPIQSLIHWFIQQNSTPVNLSVHSLMLSNSGELKSTRGCEKGKLDVMKLEKLAFESSKGNNLPVYQFLIAPILSNSFFSNYKNLFITMIEKALKGDVQDASKIAAKKNITDPNVIKRAQNLYYGVAGLKKELCKKIDSEFKIVDVEKFHHFIDRTILKTYEESKTFGRLWPDFNLMFLYDLVIEESNSFLIKRNN